MAYIPIMSLIYKVLTLYKLRRVALLLSFIILTACNQNGPVTLTGSTMGTVYNVKYVATERYTQSEIQQMLEARLQQLNQIFSTYIPDSELSQFNQARTTEPIHGSREFLTVLATAREVNALSNGAFDVTVGALVNLWGFGPKWSLADTVPSQADITAALQTTGMQNLQLDLQKQTLQKRYPEIYVDLSAIAKGYAVDQLAILLTEKGIQNYLVEIGGELRASGYKQQTMPWRVAIEMPDGGKRDIFQIIEPGNQSIATSGDYRNYFEQDGKRYSHTINPRTGYPVEHQLTSVTVLADSCMLADALATALMVLGETTGYELALKHNWPVLFIYRQQNELVTKTTPAFLAYTVKQ